MLYRALRATAAIALRWYYADVAVQGLDRVPSTGPLVLIANHPNALIDPLLIGTVLHRRVLLTAKATLFEAPLLAALLRAVGVVPLRRAKDETRLASTDISRSPAPDRNTDAFRLVTRALGSGQAVLVFPEGISHDEPSIAPLKSGAARMSLQACDEGAKDLRILPIGLIYEAKERPGSRVLVRLGEPLALEEWASSVHSPDATALTAELEKRLRAVTLNFATREQATRAVKLARSLVAIASAPVAVAGPGPLDAETEVARRVDAATTALAFASPDLIASADALTARLYMVENELAARGIGLADVRISSAVQPGVRFTIREGLWTILAGIVAVLGGWSHWVPLTLGRRLALASVGRDTSQDQPAMRTILFGIALVVLWYIVLGLFLAHELGWAWAIAGVVALFAAAHAHRRIGGRVARAIRRARSYLALREDPSLQSQALAELDALVSDAVDLERRLTAVS